VGAWIVFFWDGFRYERYASDVYVLYVVGISDIRVGMDDSVIEILPGVDQNRVRSWTISGRHADRMDTLLWLEQQSGLPTLLVSWRESLRLGIGLDYAEAPIQKRLAAIRGDEDA